MNSIETLTTFLGWCTIINLGIILFILLVFSVAHEPFGKLFAKIFGVTKQEAKVAVLHVFLQYRLAFAVLNLVPYIALLIMAEA